MKLNIQNSSVIAPYETTGMPRASGNFGTWDLPNREKEREREREREKVRERETERERERVVWVC
jgi:hypothetical protein